MRLKSQASIVTVLFAAGALAACGGGEATTEDGVPKVSVSVTHPEDLYGLPWDVGREQGFFEDAGVVVDKVIPSEGGGTTLQNVVSGQLPFGEVATGAIVNGFNEDAPVQVIGGGIQSVFDVEWVVPTDSDIQNAADTADVQWGYTNPGSVTEAMSYLVPLGADVELPESGRTSTGGTGEGIALLEAGDVGLTYASPRVVAENTDSLREVISSDDFVPQYQQTLIISSRDYAKKNPEIARALLEGYAKAVQWIYDNPDKVADDWAKKADMDPADARPIVVDAVKAEHWGVAYNPEALDAAAEGLKLTDGLDSVNWPELATDEFLPEGQKGQLP